MLPAEGITHAPRRRPPRFETITNELPTEPKEREFSFSKSGISCYCPLSICLLICNYRLHDHASVRCSCQHLSVDLVATQSPLCDVLEQVFSSQAALVIFRDLGLQLIQLWEFRRRGSCGLSLLYWLILEDRRLSSATSKPLEPALAPLLLQTRRSRHEAGWTLRSS
jgi:hypothetical protein